MSKRYLELPEPEREEPPPATYGRPSAAAWAAAAAVTFAFFLLGGFIKVYRQMEGQREEARQEIDELRESVRLLQTQLAAGGRQARGYRAQPLPPAPRDRAGDAGYQEIPPERRLRPQPAPGNAIPPELAPRTPLFGELPDPGAYNEPEERKPRVQFGRSRTDETRQLLGLSGTPCQVVSVSNTNKRLMIEGGRDLGLAEGARLELCRDGRYIGELRILDVFDSLSSCEVFHSTVEPRPGDTVRKQQG